MGARVKRKYLSHFKIFDYWKDKCISEDGEVYDEGSYDFSKSVPVVNDWGEPSCWGCGKPINVEKENKYDTWLEEGDYKSIWNCKRLISKVERAHIIPHSLNGSDTDPSNLFLLCQECHDESPDMLNKKYFLKWVYKKRKLFTGSPFLKFSYQMKEAEDILKNDYHIENPTFSLEQFIPKEHISLHDMYLSDGTIIYSLVDNALRNEEIKTNK